MSMHMIFEIKDDKLICVDNTRRFIRKEYAIEWIEEILIKQSSGDEKFVILEVYN